MCSLIRVFSLSLLPLLVLPLLACGGTPTTSSSEETPASAPAGTLISAAGLSFYLPEGWRQETPSSSMRMAQAVIPGEDGPGQITAFFFGAGGGGGVEPNLARWSSQVTLDEGATPFRESFDSEEGKVTWVDLSGTLKASQIGSFPQTDQPGYRLFAAVIEGDGGPWFFRAVGPQATLDAARDDFVEMLRGARPGNVEGN